MNSMDKEINFKCSKKEIQLIFAIRNLKFGKLEIDIRDGIPQNKVKQKEKQIDISKIALDRVY